WITIIPSRLNDTGLSADECRDNWRLRYNNLAPLEMHQHCDGCSARMTVQHALPCKCTFGTTMLPMSFDTYVEAPFPLDVWSARPEFIHAQTQEGDATITTAGDNSSHNKSESDDDEHHPLPLLSVAMRAAMDSGNVAVRSSLMCASRTQTCVPNGTRTSPKS
ncbi:hypothetical protein ACHAXR_000559, partial [Thalassiosira sp. AJA248-18]